MSIGLKLPSASLIPFNDLQALMIFWFNLFVVYRGKNEAKVGKLEDLLSITIRGDGSWPFFFKSQI